jgi:hypothetical protein
MMVNWKKISKAFFALGLLGFLMTVFYALIQMVAMYAPPDMMAQQSARRGQEFVLLAVSVGILLVAGIVSSFIGSKQEELQLPEKTE